jgi:hypothetical protein
LEFNYATFELREICESRRKAVAALGAPAARALKQCLADLAALPTAADLAALFEGQMIIRSSSERSISLGTGHHLVFCAGNVKKPRTASGETDWPKVSRIRILGVEVMNG